MEKITADEFRAFLFKEILRISKQIKLNLEILIEDDNSLFDNEIYRFAYGKNAHITGGWLQLLGEYIVMHKQSSDDSEQFDYFIDDNGVYQAVDKRYKRVKQAYT